MWYALITLHVSGWQYIPLCINRYIAISSSIITSVIDIVYFYQILVIVL